MIAHDAAVRDLRRTRELYRAARVQAMAVFDAWYDGAIGAADSSPVAPTG